jgi:hypothetical protein
MPGFAEQNVFEMFVAHGRQPFWLRRTTSGNTCAKVVVVEKFKGPPPCYGNPKVFADIYDLHTGELKEARARLPVPGTYKTWRRIPPPPPWSGELDSEAETIPRAEAETAPQLHWRTYGNNYPLPTGAEALQQPLSAFPSWFLCITCDRCGKDRMVNEAHAPWRDRSLFDILHRMRHDGCGALAGKAELLTGIAATEA